LKIQEDLLKVLALILPTPRAILQIHKKLEVFTEKEQPITSKTFAEIIREKVQKLLNRLSKEKIDNKPVLTPLSKWHIKLSKLVEEGLILITPKDYLEVAEILEREGLYAETNVKQVIESGDEVGVRKIRQKVSNDLRKLVEYQLYTKTSEGVYCLNPIILAYALGIERLPDGSFATEDEVVTKIKLAIMEQRRRIQMKRKERE